MDVPPTPGPVLVVHTGAWDVPDVEKQAHLDGARNAVLAGWRVLTGGGSAAEAVTLAVATMEDDPALNAGRGSVLGRDGTVELDAAVMEGRWLDVGAVACVRDVRNPVRLACELLTDETVQLVGEAASAFADERGISRCDPRELVVEREQARLAAWQAAQEDERRAAGPGDTVGAVALDGSSRIAAASSTGGRPGQRSGRVGDAPVPGCGVYADERVAGAASTGIGEDILRLGLARRAVDLAREHTAQDACWLAMRELDGRLSGHGGVIVVGRDASIGWGFNTPSMGVAWMAADLGEPVLSGIRLPS